MRQLADYLGGISGRRKALVLFSEGIDYDINDLIGNRDATDRSSTRRATLIAAATRANVAIYGVDPRGLGGLAHESIEIQSFPDDTIARHRHPARSRTNCGSSQDSLRVLADETGGFAVVNTNDFATRVPAHRRRQQLVLRARLLPDQRQARRPLPQDRSQGAGPARGLRIRARKGYVAAARQGAGDQAGRSERRIAPSCATRMASPLPMSELPMAVTAAVFKGPAPNGSVVMSTLIAGSGAAAGREGRHVPQRPRAASSPRPTKGKTFSRRPQHAEPEHEAGDRRSASRRPASA